MFIHARVFPESKKDELVNYKPGYFKIFVKSKAKQNLANSRARSMLAEHFSVPVSSVRIVNGHHERTKLISVNGLEKY